MKAGVEDTPSWVAKMQFKMCGLQLAEVRTGDRIPQGTRTLGPLQRRRCCGDRAGGAGVALL